MPVPGLGFIPLKDLVDRLGPELDAGEAIYLQAASQLAAAALGGEGAPRSPLALARLLLSPSEQARELAAALGAAAGDGGARETVAELARAVVGALAERSAARLGVPVDTLFPGLTTATGLLLPQGA